MRDLTLYPFEVRPLTKEEGGGYLISFSDFSECISMNIVPADNDDLERLLLARNPSFQALMAQAEESIKAGRTLSSDEFWRQAYARADARSTSQTASTSASSAPALAEPRVEYRTDE